VPHLQSRLSRCALLLALALVPLAALAQDDMSMSFSVQGAGEEVNEMTVTVAGDMARFDMGSDVSMVWSPDWWRMIQHKNRMYMEFDKAMMDRMRQMMGNMPGASDAEEGMDDFDPEKMTFERTGATDTVMGYEVFEVAFSDDEGRKGSMWMSESAEAGMFEVFARMMTHLKSLAGPMMGGGPGGRSPVARLEHYMEYARAQGIPEGKVLRMTSEDGMRFEVTGWNAGPFGADTWEAPAGYQKQAMPLPR